MITKITIKGLELEVDYSYLPSEDTIGSEVYINSIYYLDEDFSEFEIIWGDEIKEKIIELERGY